MRSRRTPENAHDRRPAAVMAAPLSRHDVIMVITALLALLAIGAFLATPAHAGEIRFTTSNDFLVANDVKDDLYTFGAELGFSYQKFDFNVLENAFTDREQGLRFDETYVSISRTHRLPHWFKLDWEVGTVHVGRGLLGERAQNALHRVIGDNEVDLPYLDQSDFHALAGVTLSRDLQVASRAWLQTEVASRVAFGFRTEASVKTRLLWRKSSNFSLFGGPGWRYVDAELEPLAVRVTPRAGTWEAGFELYSNWRVMWSENDFGTQKRHLRVDYTWRPKRIMPQPVERDPFRRDGRGA